jgi:hypothetical protein
LLLVFLAGHRLKHMLVRLKGQVVLLVLIDDLLSVVFVAKRTLVELKIILKLRFRLFCFNINNGLAVLLLVSTYLVHRRNTPVDAKVLIFFFLFLRTVSTTRSIS